MVILENRKTVLQGREKPVAGNKVTDDRTRRRLWQKRQGEKLRLTSLNSPRGKNFQTRKSDSDSPVRKCGGGSNAACRRACADSVASFSVVAMTDVAQGTTGLTSRVIEADCWDPQAGKAGLRGKNIHSKWKGNFLGVINSETAVFPAQFINDHYLECVSQDRSPPVAEIFPKSSSAFSSPLVLTALQGRRLPHFRSIIAALKKSLSICAPWNSKGLLVSSTGAPRMLTKNKPKECSEFSVSEESVDCVLHDFWAVLQGTVRSTKYDEKHEIVAALVYFRQLSDVTESNLVVDKSPVPSPSIVDDSPAGLEVANDVQAAIVQHHSANSKFSSWDWAMSPLKFLRVSSLNEKNGISPTCRFLRVVTDERNASAAAQLDRLVGSQFEMVSLNFVDQPMAKKEISVVEILFRMNHRVANNYSLERKQHLQSQGRRKEKTHLSRKVPEENVRKMCFVDSEESRVAFQVTGNLFESVDTAQISTILQITRHNKRRQQERILQLVIEREALLGIPWHVPGRCPICLRGASSETIRRLIVEMQTEDIQENPQPRSRRSRSFNCADVTESRTGDEEHSAENLEGRLLRTKLSMLELQNKNLEEENATLQLLINESQSQGHTSSQPQTQRSAASFLAATSTRFLPSSRTYPSHLSSFSRNPRDVALKKYLLPLIITAVLLTDHTSTSMTDNASNPKIQRQFLQSFAPRLQELNPAEVLAFPRNGS
ncbi:unnamed protein product [Notodromas monacha]|uniref:Uncharacterized protein n=1 Tax=Notodromas monacha TaxID=399045 RepID=A0A7R9BIE2_9CRUS|nr:unnamed protein product [Notodromas monacha]CAG0915789.1 unnamed protein product [Notodromas monacha]